MDRRADPVMGWGRGVVGAEEGGWYDSGKDEADFGNASAELWIETDTFSCFGLGLDESL